jgi:hypothetical protein
MRNARVGVQCLRMQSFSEGLEGFVSSELDHLELSLDELQPFHLSSFGSEHGVVEKSMKVGASLRLLGMFFSFCYSSSLSLDGHVFTWLHVSFQDHG